jgi:hypothetical protein
LAEAKSSAGGWEGGVDWAFAAIEHNDAIATKMTDLDIMMPLTAV